MPIYLFMTPDIWLRLIIFLENKLRIKNKQLIVQTHASYNLQSDVKNQAQSAPFVKFISNQTLPIVYGSSEA